MSWQYTAIAAKLLLMQRRVRNLWLFVTVIALAALAWLLYAIWRSPHRTDLATYWALVAAVVPIAAGLIASAWRIKAAQSHTTVEIGELDYVADLLRDAVKTEWSRAAGARGLLEPTPIPVRWKTSSLPVAGPISAAVISQRFKPLPGLRAVGQQRLRGGQIDDLHHLYGGLRSGRLIITGAPGSGKTGAAVLLLLAALKHKDEVLDDDRSLIPVPVMFTLHGWDPNSQRIEDWLSLRLQQTYPLFAGKHGVERAVKLLAAGKIAVILDGLDEMPQAFRPVALRALSQQATFRIVVLTRSAELTAAATEGLLEGAAAVQLQEIDPITAASYLARVQRHPAPPAWSELINRLRRTPDSTLANALNSPLTLTLVRDTYRDQDEARELLDFYDVPNRNTSSEDVVDHLLDRVVPAAYARKPGGEIPRYNLQTAQRVLAEIAARMNRDGTRDLHWWHIHTWAPLMPRAIAGGLAAGLATGLSAQLGWELSITLMGRFMTEGSYNPSEELEYVLGLGLIAGLFSWVGAALSRRVPRRVATLHLRNMFHPLPVILGLGVGFLFAFLPGGGAVVGLTVGLAVGISVGLTRAFSHPGADNTSALSPVTSWRSDRRYGLASGLTVGLAVGLSLGLLGGLLTGHDLGPATGLATGLEIWFIAGPLAGIPVALTSSLTWPSGLSFAQLAWRWHSPVRLMRFLDDACQRNVLRTVGPIYQFRHARLQDRLAYKDQ